MTTQLWAQPLNDNCAQAILVESTVACTEFYNEGTEFTGPQNSCTLDSVGSLWFKYILTGSTRLKIKTQQDFYQDQSNFNDVVTVFRNSCSNLQEIACFNEDKYGYTGEEVYTDMLSSGETIWIRVSGSQDFFGKCSGKICLEVQPVGATEGLPPVGNDCSNPGSVTANQPCVIGSNVKATSGSHIPSNFQNSSHCVWYTFVPTDNSAYTIVTHADFSDIITVWTGDCSANNTFELISNDDGQQLETPVLNAGQTYYIQLCGAFSSIEGNFCLEVKNSRPVALDLTAVLEGPWDPSTSTMNTVLWQFDLLPTGQPYDGAPWNYSGTEGSGWSKVDYPANTVDWVLISLRRSLQANDVLDQAAAILLEDGSIQLLTPMEVAQGVNEVYLVLEHRNHLPVMTSTKIQITNNQITYDFTQQNGYAPGSSGQKEVNGTWMLFSGNVDQSNISGYEITGSDRIQWRDDTGLFNVYLGTDFNMDRDVNGADIILWQDNNGIFSNIPK